MLIINSEMELREDLVNFPMKELIMEPTSPDKEFELRKEGEIFSKIELTSISCTTSKKDVTWEIIIGVKLQMRNIIEKIKKRKIIHIDKFLEFDFLYNHLYNGKKRNARMIPKIIAIKMGFKSKYVVTTKTSKIIVVAIFLK